jgi:trans-2,3-dihydro-3-hydroxyanthranilate isomerase
MRMLAYEIVDVFTDRPFTGNPLAVVFDADELSGDQMQALAREFNLSETVFVLPCTDSGAAGGGTYRARIFTPDAELPFAGHPSVGAAVTVARRGLFGASDTGGGVVVQECGAGLLPIGLLDGAHAQLTGGTPAVSDPIDPGPLLDSVGLGTADLAGHDARTAGCGLEFAYLSVRADAVGRAAVHADAARRHGVRDVSVFHWDSDSSTAHTRVFVPGLGVPEDPATGSAALGFGVWLVANGLTPADGDFHYTVHQGAELHRPSTLTCTVSAQHAVAVRATVTGGVVPIARGEIVVPPFVG